MKKFIIHVILLSSAFIINCFAQETGWEIIPSGTTEELNSIYFYDYQTGNACGNSGVVIKSVDSGKTWQSLQSPLSINLNDCFMFGQECFLSVGDSGMCLVTWDGGDSLIIGDLSEYGVDIYSVAFSKNPHVSPGVFGGSSQTLFIATTSYCTTVINDVYGGSTGGFWGAYMLTDETGFVAGENSISQPIVGRTTDGGSSWDYISFYLDGNEGRATGVAFTDSLIGYISALVWDGRGAIAKTSDNGNNWTTTFFNNPLWDINLPLSDASQLGYCVGDSGTIFKTFNAGESWDKQFTNTSEKLNKVFFLDSDFGFAVGENGMILRTTTGGEPVTDAGDIPLLPLEFNLSQNYPNPFNPSTKIEFRIADFGFVSLKVYDVLGNEIVTLINEEKQAGSYEVEFDASNLPSGVYFYRLQAGSFNQIRKMILIK